MSKRIRSRRGFTLIELLVVLVILALLAGIVLPRFLSRSEEAKVKAARTQIANFRTSLQMYALDNGQPPSTEQGLEALMIEPTSSPKPRSWKKLLDAIPKDPWGNDYIYESPGPNDEEFIIISLGKDGREGGSGDDADIDSLQTEQ